MTRKYILSGTFIISVFVCLSANEALGQQTYRVNNTGDTGSDSCATSTAPCSLRGAILAASASPGDGDIIEFAIPASDPSCVAGVCTINLPSGLPLIDTGMSIMGPGADKLTVRRGGTIPFNVFRIGGTGGVTLSGLTIANGSTPGSGGGITSFGSGVVNVTNCTITGNLATNGAAGGGIYHAGNTMNITNSTISGNQAINGSNGGVDNRGTMTITGSTISGNSSGSLAGGVFNSGTLTVTNSTISGNTSGDTGGGGIYNQLGATLNVTNSTVSGNTCLGQNSNGGGISNSGGTLNVTNSTISGNTCNGNGGGISGGAARVQKTIIAMNTATTFGPDVIGNFLSTGFNLIGKKDDSSGFIAATDLTGTVAAPLNPMLDPAGLRNNGGPTRTIALLAGSPAIDKGGALGLNDILLTTDQRGAGFPRTFDNPAVTNASDGTDIGAFERGAKSPFDFDGDGKTDVGIFRPSVGEWWYQRSSNGQVPAVQFGTSTDKMVPGDYTGDGKTDIAFWRPSDGNWFVLRSEDSSYFAFPFGSNGDIPAPADYDGDGRTDPAVFRPTTTTWFVSNSGGSGTSFVNFGISTDKPVVADYDGDAKADIAIWRSGPGEWWVRRSTNGSVLAVQFGTTSDRPVQGDYTGDGKADIAFWRPANGNWFIIRSEDSSFLAFPFGASGDTPVPGDYDGDGRQDAAVFRPTSATWFLNRSTAGVAIQQFGLPTDTPIPSAFVP